MWMSLFDWTERSVFSDIRETETGPTAAPLPAFWRATSLPDPEVMHDAEYGPGQAKHQLNIRKVMVYHEDIGSVQMISVCSVM